jgi:hypothetical protein
MNGHEVPCNRSLNTSKHRTNDGTLRVSGIHIVQLSQTAAAEIRNRLVLVSASLSDCTGEPVFLDTMIMLSINRPCTGCTLNMMAGLRGGPVSCSASGKISLLTMRDELGYLRWLGLEQGSELPRRTPGTPSFAEFTYRLRAFLIDTDIINATRDFTQQHQMLAVYVIRRFGVSILVSKLLYRRICDLNLSLELTWTF